MRGSLNLNFQILTLMITPFNKGDKTLDGQRTQFVR